MQWASLSEFSSLLGAWNKVFCELRGKLLESGPFGILGSGCWQLIFCFPITDYVFVVPVEVDSGGSYISHDILHHRKRRSAHGASNSLHYRVSAFGQDLHLELKPSAILSSHFRVQVLGKDGASETREPEVPQCLYQGFIRNDSSSSVAVSTCAGLVSLPCSNGTRSFVFCITWMNRCPAH